MVKTTRKQRESLLRLWNRLENKPPFKAFRKNAQGTIGMDSAIVIPYCGFWVAIERDGYSHS